MSGALKRFATATCGYGRLLLSQRATTMSSSLSSAMKNLRLEGSQKVEPVVSIGSSTSTFRGFTVSNQVRNFHSLPISTARSLSSALGFGICRKVEEHTKCWTPVLQPRVGMASLYNMHRTGPHHKKRPPRQPLDGNPQMKGVVIKTLIKKPKKPNSANRKCVLVRLTNGKEKVAFVPGIGHNLQEHNIVLCEVHRLRDTPGVKIRCIRGKYDLPHVQPQKQA